MISCLTITQPGREQLLADCLHCFAHQSFEARELVIIHDGGDNFHDVILRLVAQYPRLQIRVSKITSGHSLGYLRNQSIALAQYDIVCQWDDDDLYHPDRLNHQYEELRSSGADFCFLGDQLHYFSNEEYFFWDDWASEKFPGNLIQGSLMGRKKLIGDYPDKARGEDTELVYGLVRQGRKLHRITDCAWLYIYTYHGDNAWEASHHKAISQIKRLRRIDLEEKIALLEKKLTAYSWKFSSAYFPNDAGGFTLQLSNDEQ